MNSRVDNWHCNICRACNRSEDYMCRKSCRLCGTYLFSEDKINVYNNPFNPYSTDYAYTFPHKNPSMFRYHFDDGFTPIPRRFTFFNRFRFF